MPTSIKRTILISNSRSRFSLPVFPDDLSAAFSPDVEAAVICCQRKKKNFSVQKLEAAIKWFVEKDAKHILDIQTEIQINGFQESYRAFYFDWWWLCQQFYCHQIFCETQLVNSLSYLFCAASWNRLLCYLVPNTGLGSTISKVVKPYKKHVPWDQSLKSSKWKQR